MKIGKESVFYMNLPNKLTILRILCVPLEVALMLWKSSKVSFCFAFGLFLLLGISDFFDGKIARECNEVTVLGKFLDPIADKILIMSIFLCFFELKKIGILPIIIMINREFLVMAVRLLVANEKVVVSANFFGKLKTFFQISVIIMMFIELIFCPKVVLLQNILLFCINIMVAVSVLSGFIYFYENRNLLKKSC